jgi:hypothetical protein
MNLRKKENSQRAFQNPLITAKSEVRYKRKPKLPPENSYCEVLSQ